MVAREGVLIRMSYWERNTVRSSAASVWYHDVRNNGGDEMNGAKVRVRLVRTIRGRERASDNRASPFAVPSRRLSEDETDRSTNSSSQAHMGDLVERATRARRGRG